MDARPPPAPSPPGGSILTEGMFAVHMIACLAVPWTLLYGFVIFPNHPTPDMLECHEEVYYNNQTEALERDKTCKLDTQTMWGLAFLAGVASGVFSPVAVAVPLGVIGGLFAFIAHFCDPEPLNLDYDELMLRYPKVMWFWNVFIIFGPPAVPWTLLYRFGIFPNHPSPAMLECHEDVYYNNQTEALERDKTCELDTQTMWGLAFLAGVASAVFTPVLILLFDICIIVTESLLNHYVLSRSQNDTVEQEEEDTA